MKDLPYRELLQLAKEEWDKLPRDVRGHPVYFYMHDDGGIEVWPKYSAERYPIIAIWP